MYTRGQNRIQQYVWTKFRNVTKTEPYSLQIMYSTDLKESLLHGKSSFLPSLEVLILYQRDHTQHLLRRAPANKGVPSVHTAMRVELARYFSVM